MARRIGLAQALVNDPEFVILDEPTSGFDPKGRREMKDLILDLKRRGKTVLLCSHLLPDVEDVCDRVAILNKGELLILKPLQDLLARMDQVQILARNLPSDGLEKVKTAIAESRGEVLAVDHPTTTLEEVFLRLTAPDAQKLDSSAS
jgi:ABC-2 type transport system ATP-binding protein